MRRALPLAFLAAGTAGLTGCGLGWRAGVGFSANTEGSLGAQMFAGAHFGTRGGSRETLELGSEVAGSIRSKPLRLGVEDDLVARLRVRPEGKGLGWMPGFYLGVRGLFLAGNRNELREGVSFALLPTLSSERGTLKQLGVEASAGYSVIVDEPGVAKPVDDGELALRLFYEVTDVEGRAFR